jgi:hypothetical protein
MFFYLHLFQETPVSIDGIYYEEIPTEALHIAERGEVRDPNHLDRNGKETSGVEERI